MSKWCILASVAVIGLGLLHPGLAQESQKPAGTPASSSALDTQPASVVSRQFQRDLIQPFATEKAGLLRKTTVLLGKKVRDPQGRGLGRLQDLLVDLPTGRVIMALVSSGSHGQTTPVPAHTFSTADEDLILLNADREKFRGAPHYRGAGMIAELDANHLAETFRYFGEPPPGQPASDFVSAASLVGILVSSRAQESLGRVEDVLVVLPQGRVAYLLIKPTASTGSPEALYPVPAVYTKRNASGRTLVLNADLGQFLAGPYFPIKFSTEMVSGNLAAAVQQHYGPELAVSRNSDPTVRFVRGRIDPVSAPAASSPSDPEIAQAVMAEILRHTSPNVLGNLKIATVAGRVTLSGGPKRQQLRQQITAAAEHVAGAGNVEYK